MGVIVIEHSKKVHKYKTIETIVILLFVLLAAFVLLNIRIPFVSIGLLSVLTIIVFPTRSIVSKLVAFMYSLLLLIFIEGQIINFDFMPQAEVLLQYDPNIAYWFSVRHPHAVRLLVSYPGYLLSQLYGVSLDVGFSYYVSILFTLIYLIITDTLNRFRKKGQPLLLGVKGFLALVPLILLPFIMNGRLILAYLGFSILIMLFLNLFNEIHMNKVKILIIGLLGFLLTTVSSGTMTVALTYSIFLTYLLNRKRINKKSAIKKNILILILLSPLLYVIFSYFWIMLMKNVNYYGGGFAGVINMLNHGAGKILFLNKIIMVVMAFLGIIALYANIKYLKRNIITNYSLIPVLAAINVSIYGLMFGFSTGLMMIPPIIMLVLIKL